MEIMFEEFTDINVRSNLVYAEERGFNRGVEKGIEKGIEQGAIVTSINNIIAVLSKISPDTDDTINNRLKSISDLDILNNLFLKSINCSTIEEFSSYMDELKL